MTAKFVVGIDLGTTHTALAWASLDAVGSDDAPPAKVAVFDIPQLVTQASLEARPLLPSFTYFGHSSEGALALPWAETRTFAVGEYARARAVEAPNRVVSSAKSWLSHPTVDRRAAILPSGAPEDVEKISPVEASFRLLEHIAEAWDREHPDAPLSAQEVILTVPASFDAGARELTAEAAMAAGLENLTLLEEPQAALYAWIGQAGDSWRKTIKVGDVILVVDVGGGTTDFSAIVASERDGSLELHRVAVGDHILLGGDNMDLALGHVVRTKLEAEGKDVDRFQFASLVHACRSAKERLLATAGDDGIASVPIAVASRGSKLLGGGLRAELSREEVSKLIVDGFFPQTDAAARPVTRARTALTQMGLPYASDAGVTRHLAAFLGRQRQSAESLGGSQGGSGMLQPTALLFNGGVMKAPALRERLVGTLDGWLNAAGAPNVGVLEGADLDLAVARGAAAFGLARHGKGLRIRGGTARSYYVGIESAVPAVPGMDPPIVALCVAPFGMEEGSAVDLSAHELGAVVGEPVRFRFFGSSVRRDDKPGTEIERIRPEELDELAPIEVTLPAEGRRPGDVVEVRLASRVTEIGTLELEAVPTKAIHEGERFKVALSIRDANTPAREDATSASS